MKLFSTLCNIINKNGEKLPHFSYGLKIRRRITYTHFLNADNRMFIKKETFLFNIFPRFARTKVFFTLKSKFLLIQFRLHKKENQFLCRNISVKKENATESFDLFMKKKATKLEKRSRWILSRSRSKIGRKIKKKYCSIFSTLLTLAFDDFYSININLFFFV